MMIQVKHVFKLWIRHAKRLNTCSKSVHPPPTNTVSSLYGAHTVLLGQMFRTRIKPSNLNKSLLDKKSRLFHKLHVLRGVRLLFTNQAVKSHQSCSFCTSNRRLATPFGWLMLKSLIKVTAIIVGRTVGVRFRRLPPSEREKVWEYLRQKWYIPAAAAGGSLIVAGIYILSHIRISPVTGRNQFITFSEEQIVQLADRQVRFLKWMFDDKIYSQQDERVQYVEDVAKKLVEANSILKAMHSSRWDINVIKAPVVNAIVLPGGHVFIFDGILNIADTPDQLAIILGHEMAHSALSHGAERLSLSSFLENFGIPILAAIWCFIPSLIKAAAATCLLEASIEVTIHKLQAQPLEWEADHIGLMFAASACYDVREASVLWRKLAVYQKEHGSGLMEALPEWMLSHPNSLKRAVFLDSLETEALEKRKDMGCPPLSQEDPRKPREKQ